MSGAIVVEDPEGSLPAEVEAMRELVLVLQETNIESGEEEAVGSIFVGSTRGAAR